MTTDKLDTHYFQQLSALMDGDLAPDQARFLLRRLQHDTELTGCWERWQLCGDALRGRAHAPAPAGFADRIAAVIAAAPVQTTASADTSRSRGALARWGGGALAASIAAVALFMVRQQVPDETPAPQAATVAARTPAPATGGMATPVDPAVQGAAAVTAATAIVASAPRRQNDAPRRSATRNQQAARSAAATRSSPDRAFASASSAAVPPIPVTTLPPVSIAQPDPFAGMALEATPVRPWPRSAMPQYSGSGGFNAGFTDRSAETFYPFEPRLPQSPPLALPDPAMQER